MNKQQLISLVFENTRMRIKEDDPIFAIVALNDAALAEAIARMNRVAAEIDQRMQPTIDSLTQILGSIIENTEKTEKKIAELFTHARSTQSARLAADYQQILGEIKKQAGAAISKEIQTQINEKALAGINAQVAHIKSLVDQTDKSVSGLVSTKNEIKNFLEVTTQASVDRVKTQGEIETNRVRLPWWMMLAGVLLLTVSSSVLTLFAANKFGMVASQRQMEQVVERAVRSGLPDTVEAASKQSLRRK